MELNFNLQNTSESKAFSALICNLMNDGVEYVIHQNGMIITIEFK